MPTLLSSHNISQEYLHISMYIFTSLAMPHLAKLWTCSSTFLYIFKKEFIFHRNVLLGLRQRLSFGGQTGWSGRLS